MKKLTGLIILVALSVFCSVMLFSCESEGEIKIDLQDLSKVIGEKIDLSEFDKYSADKIQNEFGITSDDAVQILALKKIDENNVSNAEMLVLFEAKDQKTAKEIETKLKEYKNNKLIELNGECPMLNDDNGNQIDAVTNSEILVEQQYVFWSVNKQYKEINVNNIIKDYIKNNK